METWQNKKHRDQMINKATIVIPKKAKLNYKKALGSIREHERSGITIQETEKELKIIIETKDITALRSTMNAIIRDVQTIEAAGSV